MNNLKKILPVALLTIGAGGIHAERILHLPLEPVSRDFVKETVGNKNLLLVSKFVPESPVGAVGNALRFDGFSSYIQGNVDAGNAESPVLSFSMWVAPETYPVVEPDVPTDKKICMAGTYDETNRKGWRFSLGYTGKYAFECYSGGWKVNVEASDLLPTYEWSHLVAIADGGSKKVTLYRNGVKVGEANCMTTIDNSATKLNVGKGSELVMSGPFMIQTFNGLMDEIEVFDHALSAAEIEKSAENPADLSVPASRYETQKLRPRFHGMPATAWTNECHGMTYSNGRYHVFFQKNANGPYMTRLHWGHISTANLLDWREERIAIAPGDPYDIKGCWSGAIVTDPVLTGNRPAAIYTAVDYAKATICIATPEDDDLLKWTKSTSNPLINGRPAGLSDDFRDPYFFRNGDDAYIIVGTSKNNLGATTLHKMDPTTKRFGNEGRIFFSATSAQEHGTFWEMPNVTPMGDGKWLFTVTPLGLKDGVRCLYWVGTINSDGTFNPISGPGQIELNSKEGYGLLSPTIYQHEGKTIALGIVPDKLPGSDNYQLGWAHCYSLPREWSLSSDGKLIQKPYSGVAGMRQAGGVSLGEQTLSGDQPLDGINGRQVEIKARFTAGSGTFGIRFLGDGKLYYNSGTGELIADFTGIDRKINDGGVYSGIYRMKLPETPAAGSDMTIDFFIDGSIVDIFVNDRYAQSIRIFANDNASESYGVYSEGQTAVKSVEAWNLKASGAGIGDIFDEAGGAVENAKVDVFDLSGRRVRTQVERTQATDSLDPGIYLIDGKKHLVK